MVFSALIFSILRIHSLHLVTSPDYTYSKGYLGLHSVLGALLSIITCCGPSVCAWAKRSMRRPGRLDLGLGESNLKQVCRTTASQRTLASQITLEHVNTVFEQRASLDLESMEDHNSALLASELPASKSEAAAVSTSHSSALTQDTELSPFYWDPEDTRVALYEETLGEDLAQLYSNRIYWVTGESSVPLNRIRNGMIQL